MSDTITIEHDVEMPDFRQTGAKYPWHDMDVGTSFFVPERTKAQMAAYCRSVGKRIGRTFRCIDERDERTGRDGCRVFRTA